LEKVLKSVAVKTDFEVSGYFFRDFIDSVKFTGGIGELFGVSRLVGTGKAFALHSKAKKSPKVLDTNDFIFWLDKREIYFV
jgi:hypothetical protein